MKKQYINPEMEIINVEAPQIMAGSPILGYGESLIDTKDAQSQELRDLEDFISTWGL